MGVLGEALGGGHEFTHRGKTYKVGLITQDVKLAWEQEWFNRDKQGLLAMRDCYDREEYARKLNELYEAYKAGEYSMVSERGGARLKNLKDADGLVSLAALVFGCDQMEMLKLLGERRQEVTSLILHVMRESFPDVSEDAGPEKKSRRQPTRPN